MTPEEIIELARQVTVGGEQIAVFTISELESFTKLVAEKEREACAKVCEDSMDWHKNRLNTLQAQIAATCASSIKARGEA